MSQTDLTPKTYAQRTRMHNGARRWGIAVALCLTITVSAIAVGMSKGKDQSATRATERLVQAESRMTQTKKAIVVMNQQLKKQERALQAERHLTQRPEWGTVIRLIAQQFDDKLVMTGFHLGQANENEIRRSLGQLGSDAEPDSVWLIVTGLAETNSQVSGLILRLEELGLFKRVVMTANQREVFAGQARTGFTLACRVQ